MKSSKGPFKRGRVAEEEERGRGKPEVNHGLRDIKKKERLLCKRKKNDLQDMGRNSPRVRKGSG